MSIFSFTGKTGNWRPGQVLTSATAYQIVVYLVVSFKKIFMKPWKCLTLHKGQDSSTSASETNGSAYLVVCISWFVTFGVCI